MNLDGSVAQAKQQISSDPNYPASVYWIQSKIGKIKVAKKIYVKYSKDRTARQWLDAGWILMALEKEGLVKLPWRNQND